MTLFSPHYLTINLGTIIEVCVEQSWVVLNITLNARNYVIEKRTRNHIYSYHSEFCGNMKLWQYYPLSFVGQLREQSFWDT